MAEEGEFQEFQPSQGGFLEVSGLGQPCASVLPVVLCLQEAPARLSRAQLAIIASDGKKQTK